MKLVYCTCIVHVMSGKCFKNS